MLLYICPHCGSWCNYRLAQSIIDAFNMAFHHSQEIIPHCSVCNLDMQLVQPQDKLYRRVALVEIANVKPEEGLSN